MIDFENAKLDRFIIHQAGSSFNPGALLLSQDELHLADPDLRQILMTYFLSSFKPGATYNFDLSRGAASHTMHTLASEIFDNELNFKETSEKIAKWLQSSSQHPNIKTGELYIGLFRGCKIDGEPCDCLGIFKSENKDIFLRVYQSDQQIVAEYDEGVSIRKLDKGCLVFNTAASEGYKITIVDKVNASQEAQYWKTDFLGLKQAGDNYYYTECAIDVCRQFGDEVLTEENNVPKSEQLAYLKRSQDYFKNAEIFDNEAFTQKVIGQPQAIEAFEDYKRQFADDFGVEFGDHFTVSKPAVDRRKKYFRPVIKLDKNFHLYVHGSSDMLERGYDNDRRMSYYKLYFNEET